MNENMNLEDIAKFVELATKLSETVREEVNWLYRKPNGLLYFYKHKPSVVKSPLPFNPTSYELRPIIGDKEQLLPEKDNNLSYIPKNVLIHRDDLGKYKKEERI
jgi:hypothetical protein